MPEAIIKKNGTDYPLQTMPLHYPADRVYLDGDTDKNVQDAITAKTAPTSNVVIVTLPTVAQYGYYYFFLPTSALKAGKTITITKAMIIGSSTDISQYISEESYSPTEMGQIYKITSSAVSTGGQGLLIIFTVS